MTPFDIAFMSVASVLGVGLIAPQTWSILRSHNAAGVSVTGLVCSCISYAGWISFALHLLDVPMLVSLLFPFVLEAVTLVLALRWRGGTGGMSTAVIWLTVLLAASLVGWSALVHCWRSPSCGATARQWSRPGEPTMSPGSPPGLARTRRSTDSSGRPTDCSAPSRSP